MVLSLQPGGLENGVVNVINGLDPHAFVSSVCCLKEKGEFAQRIRAQSCEIVEFGLKRGNNLGLPLQLARAFRRLRPDIIHTRNAEAFFYGAAAAKLSGLPVIHSEHGRVFPEKWHRALVQRVMLRGVAAAFAVSKQLADDMVTQIGVPPGLFQVLYNGVDLEKFATRTPRETREKLTIGSVGRLVAVKNYDLLLRAAAQLPPELNWQVVLIGEGPERSRLETTIGELGLRERVKLLGHRDDVKDLLSQFEIFVLPSLSEGMSNTLLEAMAAGVPVVASDVGGNREIIDAGLSGLLFPSGNIEAAADAIRTLATDPQLRARMAAAGSDRAEQKFGMRVMLSAYEQLYRGVWRASRGRDSASMVV